MLDRAVRGAAGAGRFVVIIGGEGALVLGGLAPLPCPIRGHAAATPRRHRAGLLAGTWSPARRGSRSYAAPVPRGVNETISSLLLAYTAIAIFSSSSRVRCAIRRR